VEDALLAEESGADFLGIVVEHAPSPRNVDVQRAIEIRRAVSVPIVLLTVNRSRDDLNRIAGAVSPFALQLHGDETPELVSQLHNDGWRIWKALSGERDEVLARAGEMQQAGAEAILLDARAIKAGEVVYGGTGQRADWNLARELAQSSAKLILAGGLTPENVALAVHEVQPWAVDAISGIEARKGAKDAAKLRAFIRAAKEI